MNYIVKVFWIDKNHRAHNEYYEYMGNGDAKERVDREAEDLRRREANGEIDGFSVLLYTLEDY